MFQNYNPSKIYDISMGISPNMPVYKGKESKKPVLIVEGDFTSGNSYETKLVMNMHTGTHLDRSLHMVENGTTIETLPLEQVITPCKVFDFTDLDEKISVEHLKPKNIEDGDFILLKTKNSFFDILEQEFIYLDKSGAEYLSSYKLKGVGIDGLGIERNQPDHETHLSLFNIGAVILEGLRLKEVSEGDYFLVAVPINVIGAEAAPVRAFLMK